MQELINLLNTLVKLKYTRIYRRSITAIFHNFKELLLHSRPSMP